MNESLRSRVAPAARTRLMSPAQCRAGRALLNWTQMQLAEQASVVRMTVTMFEAGGTVRISTRRRLQAALERAGVVLVWMDDGGGDGAVTTAAQRSVSTLRVYPFDRKFYQSQARLIAAVARDPAHRDIREGLLALARDYKSQAERAGY